MIRHSARLFSVTFCSIPEGGSLPSLRTRYAVVWVRTERHVAGNVVMFWRILFLTYRRFDGFRGWTWMPMLWPWGIAVFPRRWPEWAYPKAPLWDRIRASFGAPPRLDPER